MIKDTPSTKVAVLTGLTMLMSGAEVSSLNAATIVQPQGFFVGENDPTEFKSYNFFDTTLGTLTGASWNLSSVVFATAGFSFTAQVNSVLLSQQLSDTGTGGPTPFNFNASFNISEVGPFIGVGNFPAGFNLTSNCGEACSAEGWSGTLTLTYNYDPAAQSVVPVPAALPLFATGGAGLGLLAWRKRRKQKAREA